MSMAQFGHIVWPQGVPGLSGARRGVRMRGLIPTPFRILLPALILAVALALGLAACGERTRTTAARPPTGPADRAAALAAPRRCRRPPPHQGPPTGGAAGPPPCSTASPCGRKIVMAGPRTMPATSSNIGERISGPGPSRIISPASTPSSTIPRRMRRPPPGPATATGWSIPPVPTCSASSVRTGPTPAHAPPDRSSLLGGCAPDGVAPQTGERAAR